MRIKLLAVGLVIIFGVAFVYGSSPGNKIEKKKNPKVVDFTLRDLEGKKVALKDYRGKVVLINIWATWCGPCRQEIPDLIKLRNKYYDKGFEVLGVVVSSKEEDVRKMVKEFKINYPVLFGTEKALKPFGKIPSIPRTFILNRDGEIVEDFTGSRNFAFFDKVIGKFFEDPKK